MTHTATNRLMQLAADGEDGYPANLFAQMLSEAAGSECEGILNQAMRYALERTAGTPGRTWPRCLNPNS